jgi:predicted amidohydrolase YtcJ
VHGPFIEAEQIKRYRALNFDVTTTMTYLFGMGDLFRKRLKPELRDALMPDLLPLRRYLDAGMTVACGADWGPKSVFEQIQLSLTHTTPSGYCNLGPAQTITRMEAVSMWTRDAARLLQWTDIGSLIPATTPISLSSIVTRSPVRLMNLARPVCCGLCLPVTPFTTLEHFSC